MAFTTHAISISSGLGLADATSLLKVAPHG
jgi:hypothetical protein